MSIIGWLALGLFSGFIASEVVNRGENGLVIDIALGIAGAILGGFVFSHFFDAAGAMGFNLYSMFAAIGGAVTVLLIYRLASRRPSV